MTSPATILLAPKMDPGDAEIKKALLLSERFSTITPFGVATSTNLKRLQDENLWEPVQIHDLEPADVEDAVDECWAFADDLTVVPREQLRRADWIKEGKLPENLQSMLITKGLLAPGARSGELETQSRDLVPTLLSVFARKIAESKGWAWTGTSEKSVTDALSRGSAPGRPAFLMGLPELPSPRPEATIRQVIEFRKANEWELKRYFECLMEIRTALTEGRLDDLEDPAEEYMRRVHEMHQAAWTAHFPLHEHAANAIRGIRKDPWTLLVPAIEIAGLLGDAQDGDMLKSVSVLGATFLVWSSRIRPSCKGAVYVRKGFSKGIFAGPGVSQQRAHRNDSGLLTGGAPGVGRAAR